jgi:CRISPR system Cascade subunit CasE
MWLSKVHLNLRSREVRRDIADPYQMHATLSRVFAEPNQKCAAGEFFWRLEPEVSITGDPVLLVQSKNVPDWTRTNLRDWMASEPAPAIDLAHRLDLERIKESDNFRYRLRANPTVCRNGKRVGLSHYEQYNEWLLRKGELHGFAICTSHSSQEQMVRGKKHDGRIISAFSVLFDGVLRVKNPENFISAIQRGIGHSKALGMGLLSVVPLSSQSQQMNDLKRSNAA